MSYLDVLQEKLESVRTEIASLNLRRNRWLDDMSVIDTNLSDATAKRDAVLAAIKAQPLPSAGVTAYGHSGAYAHTPEDLHAAVVGAFEAEERHGRIKAETDAEVASLDERLRVLRQDESTAQRAVREAEFAEMVMAYHAAIRPAIPLARELRHVAAALAKPLPLHGQASPLLDPDADLGLVLFGVPIAEKA